jgi:3-oxoacid CoA-transferase subunit B
MIPGKMVKGMGGAMDLVAGVKRVVVTMEHNAKATPDNPKGYKFVRSCSLPLTGQACVNLLITDLAVFEFDESRGRFRIIEIAPGHTLDEVRDRTDAQFDTDGPIATIAL